MNLFEGARRLLRITVTLLLVVVVLYFGIIEASPRAVKDGLLMIAGLYAFSWSLGWVVRGLLNIEKGSDSNRSAAIIHDSENLEARMTTKIHDIEVVVNYLMNLDTADRCALMALLETSDRPQEVKLAMVRAVDKVGVDLSTMDAQDKEDFHAEFNSMFSALAPNPKAA